MSNINKEMLFYCKIACCIATDDFSLLKKTLKISKKKNYNSSKIYETILQSYLFCGFPAAIESMKTFKYIYPDFKSVKSYYNIINFKKSGLKNCKLIYKKNFKKLIANMNSHSPELKEWMIIEGYGKVIGRTILSIAEREFINFAILSTRIYPNQLYSHIKGCINTGASKDDLTKILLFNTSIIPPENLSKVFMLLNKVN